MIRPAYLELVRPIVHAIVAAPHIAEQVRQ